MAGKNRLKIAKISVVIILILVLIAGWTVALTNIVMSKSDIQLQNELVSEADKLLEDGIYIRAAKKYLSALEYATSENETLERKLLDIYREGGIADSYYSLIEDRIETGKALEDEYKALAEAYLNGGQNVKALDILGKAIELFPDNKIFDELASTVKYGIRIKTVGNMVVGDCNNSGYIPAYDGEKWGYIDSDGKNSIDFKYDKVTAVATKVA